jgi:hypothetical protein
VVGENELSARAGRGPAYRKAEHAMLTAWFARTHHGRLTLRSGYAMPPEGHSTIYDQTDAGIGRSLLLRIESRLPRWSSERLHGDRKFARWGASVLRRQNCDLQFMPQHLFTITWPGQQPGFMGPVAYHLAWLPIFERFIVTASYPTRIAIRFLDVAIGSFTESDDRERSVGNIVYRDWRLQFHAWNARHRAEAYAFGLLGQPFIDRVADLAWTKELTRFGGDQLIPQAPRAASVAPHSRKVVDSRVLSFHLTSKDPVVADSIDDRL